MKYTKEQVERLQDIYNQNLAGTYAPEDLQWAYVTLTGNEQPVAVRMKKQTLYAFINYEYNPDDYKMKPEDYDDKETVTTKPLECDQDLKPIEEQLVKPEEIVLAKPTAKKKKRVTRIKKTK